LPFHRRSHLVEGTRELGDGDFDLRPVEAGDVVEIGAQHVAAGLRIEGVRCFDQMRCFFEQDDVWHVFLAFDYANPMCQFAKVAGVQRGERHGLAAFARHIEAVVPVGVFEAEIAMIADIVEGDEVFNQEMFQDGSAVDFAKTRFQAESIGVAMREIGLFGIVGEFVFEIRLRFEKDIEIAGAMDIHVGGDEAPRAMIAPHANDFVAVGDEFALLVADDGRVRSIDADAADVIDDRFANAGRLTDDLSEQVLP